MTGTTWSTTDHATGAGTFPPVLSNGNLTVGGSNLSNFCAVRAVDGYTTGLYYFEITINAIGGFSPGPGFVTAAQNLVTFGGTGNNYPGGFIWRTDGPVIGNGTGTIATWASYIANDLLCFAFNLNTSLVWGRKGAAGNWNNSGTANPATGVGGLSTSFMSGKINPSYWSNSFGGASSQQTNNFGSSAFTGTPPSGFTVGWPGTGGAPSFFFGV